MIVKVGDKLKVKVANPQYAIVGKDEIVTVTNIEPNGSLAFEVVRDKNDPYYGQTWFAGYNHINENFELIEESALGLSPAAEAQEFICTAWDDIVAKAQKSSTTVENPVTGLCQAPTGASKNDKNKPDLSLIPRIALEAEAKAFMVGENKYGRYNYTKGHKASQLTAAALRHLTAWNEGEEFDPVDGQPHLGSVKACISMILRQAELGTLIDDRFKKS